VKVKKSFYFAILVSLLVPVSSLFAQDSFDNYTESIPGSNETIEMAPIPGGTFLMGSPKSQEGRSEDEGSAQKVKVNPFWMGVYEVTWDQYDLFVEQKMSALETHSSSAIAIDAVSTPTPPYIDMSFGMGRDGYPAGSMTQYAAVMFAKWLTAQTGNFYRLPTEAEWEYACRAGSSGAYYFGDDSGQLDEFGWYKENSNEKYHKVGEKKPNKWGLYDMMGNVAEWTMDQYYKDYYSKLDGKIADNPLFLPTELYPRSVRGGSWLDSPDQLRCANRRGSDPQWKKLDPQLPKSRWWLTREPFVGFRLVRPKEQPSQKEMEKYWLKAIEDY